ncbi:MAG: glycoside hydrolase family 5 protein, partial [Myxococcota bacterium]|nr:glycoside hydrolase family 5 protein [Myxococcota bacterium]
MTTARQDSVETSVDKSTATRDPIPGGGRAATLQGPHPPSLFPVLPYRGLSLGGAEFGASTGGTFDGNTIGRIPSEYYYADTLVANDGNYPNGYSKMAYPYYLSKGMNTFRLPFRWERLQRTLNSSFDGHELAALQATVTDMIAAGAVVILDAHNYARYASAAEISSGKLADTIGSPAVPNSAFADFWKRLATLYANNVHVVFDLMNEPVGLKTPQIWPDAAQAAVLAIRGTGAKNLILIEGNEWADAKNWPHLSDSLKNVADPAKNIAFEAHAYPDDSGGGGSDTCTDVNRAVYQLEPFTAWLRLHHARGFLGEFSAGTSIHADPKCLTAVDNELKHVAANADVYIGWAYWAGGSGFGTDNPMESGVVSGKDSP